MIFLLKWFHFLVYKPLAAYLTALVSAAPLVRWASVVSEPQVAETSSKPWNLTAHAFYCYLVLAKIT